MTRPGGRSSSLREAAMLNLKIYRFITTVYKDKSGTDSAQVPVGATIELHRIGANLTASFSLAPNTDSDSIAVDDPGRVQAGDTVQVFSGGTLHTPPLVRRV